ncbi:MAG: bifunctional heptose 7-phosphate kinase/heptose 1-phosphate adenyltransferase, partial [Armatimonadota bacterium]
MDARSLRKILNDLPNVTIAVVGDFFLDRYLVIESSLAEKSVETGLTAHQVVAKRLTPGAAGTIVNNLKALGVGRVLCFGIIGADGEGYELKKGLKHIGAETRGTLIESAARFTPCYTKPMLRTEGVERELERIDIKNREPTPYALQSGLIRRLEKALPRLDGVIIADQVQERNCGVVTDRLRDWLAEAAVRYSDVVFFADSRVRVGEFRNVIVKPNMFEAVDAVRGNARADEAGGVSEFSLEEAISCARELRNRTRRPVFMTAQENGLFVIDQDVTHVPAVRVEGPIDPVGAGDS